MGPRDGLQLIVPALLDRSNSRSRSIVLCLDNKIDGSYRNTNVARFYSLLLKSINERQLVFYRAFEKPSFVSGDSEKRQVLQVYQFLCENYRVGDKISVLACSYGAQIASLIAGMIHKMGILTSGNNNAELLHVAYKLYRSGSEQDCYIFKDTHSASANIKLTFLGIWDTNPNEDYLPPAECLETFRHALALDEPYPGSNPPVEWYSGKATFPDDAKEKIGMSLVTLPTDVLEAWFSGTHDDVCGGVGSSELSQPSLSRLTLRWMVRQCFSARTDIQFDQEKLQIIGLDEYPTPDVYMKYAKGISRIDVLMVLADLRAQLSCESPSEKREYPSYGSTAAQRLPPIDDSCNDSEAVKQKLLQLGRPKDQQDAEDDLEDDNVDSTSQRDSSSDFSHDEAMITVLRPKDVGTRGRSLAPGEGLVEEDAVSPIKALTFRRPSFLRRKKRKNTRKPANDSSLSPPENPSSNDDVEDESDDDEPEEEQNPEEENVREDPEFLDALCPVRDAVKPSRTRSWKQLWRQSVVDGRDALNAPSFARSTSGGPTSTTSQSAMKVHQSVRWRFEARDQLTNNQDLSAQEPWFESPIVDRLRNYVPKVNVVNPNWVA